MTSLFARLLTHDGGQDLIEYALLGAVIGLSSLAALDALSAAISNTYGSWDAAINDLWEAPSPR